MFRGQHYYRVGSCIRHAANAAAPKPLKSLAPKIETSEEGFQLACIPQPCSSNGVSRVTLAFNAGSRFENSQNRGISHLVRRSFGVSTPDYTSVNLTRHFQQMGARVQCTTTREHIVYTVDVAPNLASRAGYLLAIMATTPAYYEWELKDTVYKLMRKDVDILTRRNLSGWAMELLHEAAFSQCPDSSGLGRSLFVSADRIGAHSIDQINQFHQHFFTPKRCSLTIVGAESDKQNLDILQYVKGGLYLHPPQPDSSLQGKFRGFVGGEIRRELNAAPSVYAYLAWPTNATDSSSAVFDVIANFLNGATGRISHAAQASNAPLIRTANGPDDTQAMAFHKAYRDHGLIGVAVSGICSKAVGERLCRIVSTLRSLNVTDADLKKAKSQCKADILMASEDPLFLASDLAIQISSPDHKYTGCEQRVSALDKVTASNANDALKKAVASTSVAFAAVGPNLGEILPLPCMLSA